MPKDGAKKSQGSRTAGIAVLKKFQVNWILWVLSKLEVFPPFQACHQCRRRKLVSSVKAPDLQFIPIFYILRNGNLFSWYPHTARYVLIPLCPSDAKRPCTTCVRSHTYAVAYPIEGVEVPLQAECTYDDREYFILFH
jgi:hypothetical protein